MRGRCKGNSNNFASFIMQIESKTVSSDDRENDLDNLKLFLAYMIEKIRFLIAPNLRSSER